MLMMKFEQPHIACLSDKAVLWKQLAMEMKQFQW